MKRFLETLKLYFLFGHLRDRPLTREEFKACCQERACSWHPFMSSEMKEAWKLETEK